jgi:hypothetical protein
MKTSMKKLIVLLAAAVILCLAVYFAFVLFAPAGTTAVIYVDGREYRRVDLSKVKEPYVIEIETVYGRNTVLVEPGAISVSYADCPDKICVHQGRLTGAGIPIVCMPHRLVIEIIDRKLDG